MKENIHIRTSPEAYKILTAEERKRYATEAFKEAEKHKLEMNDSVTITFIGPHSMIFVVTLRKEEYLVHILTTEEADRSGLPRQSTCN